MPVIGVDTILTKGENCVFGVCLSWSPYSELENKEAYNATKVEIRVSGSPCENGVYRGESLHYMTDSNGVLYAAYTRKQVEVADCGT